MTLQIFRPFSFLIALMIMAAHSVLAASFTPLGFLPGGTFFSDASGVSPDGRVIVGTSNSSNGDFEAFRWTKDDGIAGLGDLPGSIFGSKAYSVSANGGAVVGRGSAQSYLGDGFYWSSQAGMQPLGHLPTTGFSYSYGLGVSVDGQIAVGISSSTSGNQAFRWTAADGPTGLGDLPGGVFESYADGISANGKVIVGESKSGTTLEAFRWTVEDGMQGLGFLPGVVAESHADSVSDDGSVIVGSDGTQAWRWTKATGIVSLNVGLEFNGFDQRPISVSGNGSVIVGSRDFGGPHAFLWDAEHGVQDLKSLLQANYGITLPGWTLTYANGTSYDGTVIVGEGINPNGRYEAWAVNLSVPEPSMLYLTAVAVFAVARIRRRPTSHNRV